MGLKKFCLFEGRHKLPKNEGAIYTEFDFSNFKAIKSNKYYLFSSHLFIGGDVALYVTGLTPALIETLQDYIRIKFLNNKCGKLYLLHYNNETKKYVKKLFKI